MTAAGGYWVNGLNEGGMGPDDFDVSFFPRWRSQRHQFGAAGYALMKTSQRKDEAWEWIKFCSGVEGMRLSMPKPNTTPTRRSLVNEALYAGTGPALAGLLRHPRPVPDHRSDPGAAAAGRRGDRPDQERAGRRDRWAGSVKPAMVTLQRDLELALRRT